MSAANPPMALPSADSSGWSARQATTYNDKIVRQLQKGEHL